MRGLLIVLAFLVVNVVAEIADFKDWKTKHGKNYTNKEKAETEAQKAYEKNVAAIKKHNSNPKVTYKLGTNDAADTTEKDRAHRRGFKPSKEKVKFSAMPHKVKGAIPQSVSYISKMSPVKDQGKCGSCWAFSAVSVLEYWSNYNNSKLIFSEQNLIDCDKASKGCDGGSSYYAFDYASKSGISDGNKYKYVARDQKCQRSKYPAIFKMSNLCAASIDGDEETLKAIIATYGPFASQIDTNINGFDFYKSGVISSTDCSSDHYNADHAVTIVGYGTDASYGDYWLVRNSWGKTWGEKGYFRIERGSNMCGIANEIYGYCKQ